LFIDSAVEAEASDLISLIGDYLLRIRLLILCYLANWNMKNGRLVECLIRSMPLIAVSEKVEND